MPTTTSTKRGRETNRSAHIEEVLDAFGVSYAYRTGIALTDILRHPETQVRLGDLHKDTVANYATKLKAGVPFPPVVVLDDESGLLSVDGNHRIAGHLAAKQPTLDAYVIDNGTCDPDLAFVVGAALNGENGLPLVRTELERSARRMRALNFTDERIATTLGLTKAKVNALLAVDNFTARCETVGVSPKGVGRLAVAKLNGIGLDAVFAAATDLVRDAALRAGDISPILADVAGQPSETAQLAVIARERTDRAAQIAAVDSGRRSDTPPAKQSVMALGRLAGLFEAFPRIDEWVPPRPESREEWLPKIESIITNLTTLRDAYRHAQEA